MKNLSLIVTAFVLFSTSVMASSKPAATVTPNTGVKPPPVAQDEKPQPLKGMIIPCDIVLLLETYLSDRQGVPNNLLNAIAHVAQLPDNQHACK